MEFVGPVNSAQVHCSQKTGSTIAAEKKKKKKKLRKRMETQTQHLSAIQTSTKCLFVLVFEAQNARFQKSQPENSVW